MRHQRKINKLSRKSSHRKAMLSNMASSLILHKKISTTLAKAKALRTYVEPLISKSKLDTTHSRRIVFAYLKDKKAVSELFREVSTKVADRPGGYTRILKTGNRLGDNSEMCIMELVDYNETMLASKTETKEKTTRRGRRGVLRKKQETETTPISAKEDTTEVVKPETSTHTETEVIAEIKNEEQQEITESQDNKEEKNNPSEEKKDTK